MDWGFLSCDGVKFGCWIHELFCARRIPRDDIFMNASCLSTSDRYQAITQNKYNIGVQNDQ